MKKGKVLVGFFGILILAITWIMVARNQKNINKKSDSLPIEERNFIQEDINNTNQVDKSEIKGEEKMEVKGSVISWMANSIDVYTPQNGGVWYPRIIKLKNGDMLCGFDTNEDGGRSVIKMVRSSDGGITWTKDPIQGTNLPEYDCANANFYEFDNGELWLAYRANVFIGDSYYSSICINQSKDGGYTWEEHSLLTEESGQGGVYEPHFQIIGNDISVFYANDSLNVVRNNRQQNIEYKIWRDGVWSDTYIASNGQKRFSRDGMPIISTKADGSYAMVIESTSLAPSAEFIIQIMESEDGYGWETPLKNIYIPKGMGKKAGAPYIVTLEDGRLVVAFQTDEDASGFGDHVSKMKVIVSGDSRGEEFGTTSEPFVTPDGYTSSWNCLYTEANILYAFTSTNYPTSSIRMNKGSVQ